MQKRSKTHEQAEFEIRFYEQLVNQYPDFADALMALGEAYTRRGWYEKGLLADLKLAELKRDDSVVWYNHACSYALLTRPDDALEALQRAIALGNDDFEHLIRDPDLATIRQSPKFRLLLEQRIAAKPS